MSGNAATAADRKRAGYRQTDRMHDEGGFREEIVIYSILKLERRRWSKEQARMLSITKEKGRRYGCCNLFYNIYCLVDYDGIISFKKQEIGFSFCPFLYKVLGIDFL